MHDIAIISKLNAEAVARWKPTPDAPHAIVHRAGVNVQGVIPCATKAEAEDKAAALRMQLGDSASVL